MTVSLGTLLAALAEFTRFHCLMLFSSVARRPMLENVHLLLAQCWTRLVTSALTQPSGCEAQPGLPLVSVEVAILVTIAGWLVQRDAVVGPLDVHTSQGWALQSVFPEWKFHSESWAFEINASATGAVFQVMNDRAVRKVPLAFFVPGLPKSSSVSFDQSTVSPCWT